MEQSFLASEVARIIEWKTKAVVDATDRGLVTPIVEAKGSGTNRLFSFTNLIQFEIYKFLKTIGYNRAAIKGFFHNIENTRDVAKTLYRPEIEAGYILFLEILETMEKRRVLQFTLAREEIDKPVTPTMEPAINVHSCFLLNITGIKTELCQRINELNDK
jgi:hypothetical protein